MTKRLIPLQNYYGMGETSAAAVLQCACVFRSIGNGGATCIVQGVATPGVNIIDNR